MDYKNLIFISHSSEDSQKALELYHMLLEMEPSWKGKVFLDCSEERPIDNSKEWRDKMLHEAEESRHLIFITSSLDYLRDGKGWVYEEVSAFQNLKADRDKHGRGHKNISYFGIFLCPCDFENELFTGNKGSDYRKLYQRPQNLVLGEDIPLEEARERIRNKVTAEVYDREDDDRAATLLDKVKAFQEQKLQDGTMLHPKAIESNLLPSVECDDNKLYFNQLCGLVEQTNVQLLGAEGGCGKTTLLTKLFHRHLQRCVKNPREGMIPLYVDAKNLFGKNNLILRYLAKHLFREHTAQTAEQTSHNVSFLSVAFSQEVEQPRYLLIIDGYNELPDESEKILKKELKQFLPGGEYENVRVVISGRHISEDLPESVFAQATVQGLDKEAVKDYLKAKNANGVIKQSLLRVLSIPMYLKMYADTAANSGIQTKADLLCAFLRWQQEKDDASATDSTQKQQRALLLYHFLPAVAYGAVTGSHGGSSFVFTEDALEEMISDRQEDMQERDYRRHYGDEFREQLKNTGIGTMDSLDLMDEAVKYFVSTCKLLHRDNDGNFDFVHQVYRDFFCAWYIAEDMRLALKKDACCHSLAGQKLEGPVKEFAAELLGEKEPYFNNISGSWDFSCNEDSVLVKMLDIIRREQPEGSAVLVANVLRMLKYARRKNLCGLDLSGLDLTQSYFHRCYFSPPQRENAPYATSFAGAKLNRENLFMEHHDRDILAACTNDRYVACVDSGGVLKLWKKTTEEQYPLKILTDVRYAVRQLLFHPEGDKLYAMTAHEILEIPIPGEFISSAQVRVVMKTPQQLRQMALDEGGKLLFTTNMNSFNFRCVDDPDRPDKLKFYGINSAASVNSDGSRLAFGYVSGYEGLKLFDIHEDGTWQERSYGYGQILNQYFVELEAFFQRIKLYNKFPTNNEKFDKRRTYFSYMQNQLIDRTHDHYEIPQLIVNRCVQTLGVCPEGAITLYPNQLKKLEALAQKYACLLREALAENGLLMQVSGRKITGLQFQENSNTLLISSTIDYQELFKKQKKEKKADKKCYDNMVLELDTDTYKTRLIARYPDLNPIRAFYCGSDTVVMTRYYVTVYDSSGAVIARLKNKLNRVKNYISPPDSDTFYVISNDYVYEMDRQLRCVRSMGNILNTVKQYYYRDAQGREYLCRQPEENGLTGAVDLRSGTACKLFLKPEDVTGSTSYAAIGPMKYKTCGDQLVAYENDIKGDQMTLPYRISVVGCDFTGVTGTVTDPRYLQILSRMGAKTDPVTFPEAEVSVSDETFTPSDTPLTLPEELPESHYGFRAKAVLRDECNFGDTVGGNDLYTQKTWAMIQKGSFSTPGLEAADYSLLEWVDRLRYATYSMVRDLAEAGIITQPRQYTDVGKRLIGPLHKTYKFVFRTRFSVDFNPVGELITTVEEPYGAKLLQYITNGQHTNRQYVNPLLQRYNGSSGYIWSADRKHRKIFINDFGCVKEIRRTLALNRWFTLTARRYKDSLEDYFLNSVFDANSHFNGRANVHGYIRLGEQAFFAQAVRSFGGGEVEADIVDKVERLCILSEHYPSLECYGQQISGLRRQPAVVLICEDLAQCETINREVESKYPNVRKLFTFDSLLASEEAAEGAGNYLEFVAGVPYSVRLESLL